MKYAPNTDVEISFACLSQTVEIRIRDYGPGISAENLERIFLQFERATSSLNVSGLGLGLYISRQIMKSHGGSLSVISEVGRGRHL